MQTAIREIVQPESWILDPSLVLYLPLYKRDGLSFMSDDAYGHLVTRTPSGHLHFTGTATSNVNMGPIHNASTKLWISIWFKLDTAFSSASGTSLNLWGKWISVNDRITIFLNESTGKLSFYKITGGSVNFFISTVASSWAAGTWHHVIASISDVGKVRFVVNGAAAITHADGSPAPNGGNILMGSEYAGASGNHIGEIRDVVIGTDDLTTGEETDLYNGILPGDETEYWPMDEGTGSTVYDREGTAPADGTIDSAPTWGGPMHWRLDGHYFDGFDDIIRIPNTDMGGFPTGNSPITVMAWFKTALADTRQVIVMAGTQGANLGVLMEIRANNTLGGSIHDGSGSILSSVGTATVGTWYLLTYTYDTSDVTLYLDDNIVDGPDAYTNGNLGIDSGIDIGAYDPSAISFRGTIGAAWIYSRALNPLEIQWNYLATKWRYQ